VVDCGAGLIWRYDNTGGFAHVRGSIRHSSLSVPGGLLGSVIFVQVATSLCPGSDISHNWLVDTNFILSIFKVPQAQEEIANMMFRISAFFFAQ